MDKVFGSKRLSFSGIKGKMESAQQELNTGWRNIAEKAKKEAKIVNKKAKKVLELEDGGHLREQYLMTVNLNAGHDLFKRFQENWYAIHQTSVVNVKKAQDVEKMIASFAKDYQKSCKHLQEFQANLLSLPEVLARVEIVQNRIDVVGNQVKEIENLLLEYEDACERLELAKQKEELKIKLSQLVETKHAEYTLKKSIVQGKNKNKESGQNEGTRLVASPAPINTKEYEKQNSLERQKAYQDAFLDQMKQYIQHGQVEKPIAGSATEYSSEDADNIEIGELDLSTLREFLGPEEINSVIQASASQSKALRESKENLLMNSDDKKSSTAELEVEDNDSKLDITTTPTRVSTESQNTKEKENDSDNKTAVGAEEEEENTTIVDVAEDIEPTFERKPSAASDDEFYDAAE